MGLGSRSMVLIGMLVVIGVMPAGAAAQGAVAETHVSNSHIQLGESCTDLATVTGPATGPPPTGTVTFRIYGPDDPACAGPPVATSTDALDGTAPYQAESDPVCAAGAGDLPRGRDLQRRCERRTRFG